MADDKLKLNALDRYRKRSTDLVLQEYSSCEVPAGCGGVVMRWVDLREAIPIEFYVFSYGKCRLLLDGDELSTAAPLVEVGQHVLAAHLTEAPAGAHSMKLAAVYRPNPLASSVVSHHVLFSSEEGTGWVATTRDPGDDPWTREDFDDSSWHAMEAVAFSAPEARSADDWRHRRVAGYGAAALGLSGRANGLYVRRRFVIEPGGTAR